MTAIAFTVDLEPDCPPYLNTWRGVEEGLPRLLELLDDTGITATFFSTGDLARRYPGAIENIVRAGHELGCHGDTHRSFAEMKSQEAREEIAASSATLREFAPVTSFRAPYLQFPKNYLPLLAEAGYTLDSSIARYKFPYPATDAQAPLPRYAVSVTSSWLRLPAWVRDSILNRLNEPAVLYVHPWEFVDLRKENLRLDCRFKTGKKALRCLRDVVGRMKQHDGTFLRMRELKSIKV